MKYRLLLMHLVDHIHWVLHLCCDFAMVLNVLVRVAPWMSPLLTMNCLCYSICCYFYYLSFLLYCCCYCCCHHRRQTHSVDRCSNCSMNCSYLFGWHFDCSTEIERSFVLLQTETIAVSMTMLMMTTISMNCWPQHSHLSFFVPISSHFVQIVFVPKLMGPSSSAKNGKLKSK